VVGGHHGECGARAYNWGLGAEPPAGSRGRPLVRGSGRRSPPEAESILVIGCPTEPANLAPFQKCPFEQYALLWSTGVRVGGPECIVLPIPVIGGLSPPPPDPRLRRLWTLVSAKDKATQYVPYCLVSCWLVKLPSANKSWLQTS